MEKFSCILYLLLLSWAGCCVGTRNEPRGIQQLPAIIDKKIYFSAVIEKSKSKDQPSHVVVFVLNPFPGTTANATEVTGSMIAGRRKATSDVDCLLAPSWSPQEYIVTDAMNIPGNEPSRYFDIIRCEIPGIMLHQGISKTNSSLLVHLLSGTTGSLVKFVIPHESRSAGHLATPLKISDMRRHANIRAGEENLCSTCSSRALPRRLVKI